MQSQIMNVNNGVNVEALLGAREALGKTPEAARFRWRATSQWVRGTHTRATIDTFHGLGGEQKHRQPFTFETDHPEIFASEDADATPEQIAALVAQSQKRSAVFDVMTNPTDVHVTASKVSS